MWIRFSCDGQERLGRRNGTTRKVLPTLLFYKLFETMQGEMIGFVFSGYCKALMGPTGLPYPVDKDTDIRRGGIMRVT